MIHGCSKFVVFPKVFRALTPDSFRMYFNVIVPCMSLSAGFLSSGFPCVWISQFYSVWLHFTFLTHFARLTDVVQYPSVWKKRWFEFPFHIKSRNHIGVQCHALCDLRCSQYIWFIPFDNSHDTRFNGRDFWRTNRDVSSCERHNLFRSLCPTNASFQCLCPTNASFQYLCPTNASFQCQVPLRRSAKR
jgi:hypothetical protein